MKNNETPKKNYVYLDNYQPLVFEHSLIVQTHDKLVIVNTDNGSIISKNGIVNQVYHNKYFVMRDTNNLYGVISFDGVVQVPFKFFNIMIWDNIIKVQKHENSDYEQYCTIPK